MNVWLRSTRETVLFGVMVGLLGFAGLSRVYDVGLATPGERLAQEEAGLKRELARLTTLHARSEEIRAQYAARSEAVDDPTEASGGPGDILARLEALAEPGQVTLIEVLPNAEHPGQGASLSLEFEGLRGPVGDFLERMVREVRAQVLSLDASVDARGVVRCQAKIAFRGTP